MTVYVYSLATHCEYDSDAGLVSSSVTSCHNVSIYTYVGSYQAVFYATLKTNTVPHVNEKFYQ